MMTKRKIKAKSGVIRLKSGFSGHGFSLIEVLISLMILSVGLLAVAQMQVAAPGLGLGTSFTGAINTAAQSYPPLVEALGLPEGHVPYGTFVIGYPAEKYQRIPVRKPVNVTWL